MESLWKVVSKSACPPHSTWKIKRGEEREFYVTEFASLSLNQTPGRERVLGVKRRIRVWEEGKEEGDGSMEPR